MFVNLMSLNFKNKCLTDQILNFNGAGAGNDGRWEQGRVWR